MGSKRRYKIGRFPVYDNTFNRLRLESNLLNAGNMNFGANTLFADKQSWIGLKLSLQGNEQGYYFREGDRYKAKIPYYKSKLKDIAKSFRKYKKQQINLGFEEPQKYPVELEEKRLICLAKLDVLEEELILINENLKKYAAKKEDTRMSKILRRGPEGSGQCSRKVDGALSEIDGQQITKIKNVLVINEPSSPYHGLKVSDYRMNVVKPWIIAKGKIRNKKDNLFKKLAHKGVFDAELRKSEWNKLRKKLIKENEDWERLFRLKLNGKPAMPSYPDECEKYID